MTRKKSIIGAIMLALIMTLSACSLNNGTTPVVNNINFNQNNNSNTQIVFYYSNTCPHCLVVEEFIKANGIKDKLDFISKEVGENQTNADELLDRAAKCGIKPDAIGVPFLWDGAKCVIGQDDIINFFKVKTNVQ